MGPITVSRAPEGLVGRGILNFYDSLGGHEPVGAPKRGRKRNIKKLKSLFFFQNLHFAFVGPFCGSNGLGTPQTTIKVEDSAPNEPLGSSGDCNRTHFRPIFRLGGKVTRRRCWWSFFKRIVIQSSGPTSCTHLHTSYRRFPPYIRGAGGTNSQNFVTYLWRCVRVIGGASSR